MPSYRFGKNAPKQDYRTLRLKNYLTASLAAPPASCDILARVYQKLHATDPTKLFPMDGNDHLGDCTIAGLAHADTVFGGLIGKQKIMARQGACELCISIALGINAALQRPW